ncbi:hypothetical protein MSAN_01822900 [Mycena sanguinolenta]|uniref:F-box domain-containing protein n=1 Tax=Mycena sanguinolenta TaxID=230812 RepID=A0A8H6XUX1_9AGAR|nr:hypothetical protein MSAN_01822900 [Mycena sanguinolenta]
MPSLSDLPAEILMEIVSYYPQLIHGVPTGDRFMRDKPLQAEPSNFRALEGVDESFVGNQTLRYLSQTSRRMRDIFLPMLWARFHACFTRYNWPRRKIKTRAKMLERRMKGIQKTPYILPYIRTLTITLQECSMGNWQPMAEFIRVLDLLPNLKDLTILRVPSEMVAVLSTSCRGKVFPSVSQLALDNSLAPIMPCFPNIQTLTFIWPACIDVLVAVKDYCQSIHTINNFLLSPEVVKCLRDVIPNVKQISLWSYHGLSQDKLCLLESMEALSELRIHHRPLYTYASQYLPPLSQEIVAAAKRVLGTSKAVGRKTLCFHELTNEGTKETVITVGGNM